MRNKLFYTLNIFGLGTAIGCFILLYLYIDQERSYDTHFKDSEKIFRIYVEGKLGKDELKLATLPTSLGPTMKELYPEVKHSVRFTKSQIKNLYLKDRVFTSKGIIYADSTFFEVFSLPLIKGNAKAVLSIPATVVISNSLAKKLYGEEYMEPVSLEPMRIGPSAELYHVAGVYEDIPENTHFHADVIIAMNTLNRSKRDSWVEWDYYTYLLLGDKSQFSDLEKKLNSEVFYKYYAPALEKEMGLSVKEIFSGDNFAKFILQPITDIHLYSNLKSELEPNGSILYVKLFSLLAIFVLVLAFLNFLNFSTALYSNRAKEVGVSKVLGASKSQLMLKFIQESVVLVLISVMIGFFLSASLLPFFNSVVGQNFKIDSLFNQQILSVCFILVLLLGILAGSYPAFYLSSFKPINSISSLGAGFKKKNFRSIAVTFQLCSAFILITGTIIIYKQLVFINEKNLGFNKDRLLVVVNEYLDSDKLKTFKQKLSQYPTVSSITVSAFLPVRQEEDPIANVFTEKDKSTIKLINWWRVDEQYILTYGIKFKLGTNFSDLNDTHSIIINETTVKQFDLVNPIGKRIGIIGNSPDDVRWYQIIGVVEDFHFNSLHEKIQSLALILGESTKAITVRINSEDLFSTVKSIATVWKAISPEQPFDFYFLDDKVQQMYNEDIRLGRAFLFFSSLSIITACLALYGLSAYLSQSMAKEISIRKVLGATSSEIITIIYKDITLLIGIAILIALPILVLIVDQWLTNFAYKVDIGISAYVISGTTIILLAFCSVGYHTFKAANSNPIEWLKT